MNARLLSATLVVSIVAASCGGGGGGSSPAEPPPPPPAPSPSGLVVRNVVPTAVDPTASVSSAADYHVVIAPPGGVAPVNRLLVFLPGTQGVPSMYQFILKSGASRGYHAFGLDYPNPTPVGVICATSTDQGCFQNVRTAIIQGGSSRDIAVQPQDAIVTRLVATLQYLDTRYPGEGWGQYVSGGQPVWSKIVVGGHSQGGGHAGLMSKLYSLHRACYFSSPPDWNAGLLRPRNAPAAWMSLPNLTPASAQYGLAGLNDTAVPYTELSVIWQTLGLNAFGAAVSVDGARSYGGSHQLTTSATPNTSGGDPGNPDHGVTVRDAFTPVDANGAPVFDPVWAYMCFD